jgi:rhomboid protease GluP
MTNIEYLMHEDGLHPCETILRLCAAAAPEPWYPRLYIAQEGVDPSIVRHCLEELWMSGLIERADGGPEKGPAISLTQEGQRVLLDPESLQRLRMGQPISRMDRGGHIRKALYGRARAVVTLLLILFNVLIFAWGYFAACDKNIGNDFLRGVAEEREKQNVLQQIQEKSGALSAYHLIDGQWQRLLTAGFVHFGFLHLSLNMVFLYLAGRFIEPMWGHVRFLVIYLAGVLGGSCLAVVHNVAELSSASDAVCGLLAAEAVWLLFNHRYLPRPLRRSLRTSLLVNLVLLVFIGSFRNVGSWGLLGGGVAEAMTALLLQLHRFGPSVWRWLALVGFVPLVWYGPYAVDRARHTNPAWQEIEEKHFLTRLRPQVQQSTKRALEVYQEKIGPLLERHPTRRDPAQVKAALPLLDEQQHQLNAVVEQLARAGPYVSPETEEARQVGQEYTLAMREWFAAAEHVLQSGDKRTDKDRQALRQREEKAKEKRREWNDLFE